MVQFDPRVPLYPMFHLESLEGTLMYCDLRVGETIDRQGILSSHLKKKFNFLQPSEAACWLTLCVKIDSSCFLSPCSLPPPPSFSLSPSLPICLPLTSALTWSRIQSKRGFVLSHKTVSLIGLVSAPEVSMWTTFYLSSSAVSSDDIRGSGGYES